MNAILRKPRILSMSVGSLLNNLGNWSALIALLGIASQRFHASGLVFAALGVVWSAPRALLGPMPGRLVDRVGPKRILAVGYSVDAVICLAFLAAGSVAQLLIIGLLHGLVFAFAIPAEAALPPQVGEPDELAAVNSMMALSQHASIVIGPAIAASLIMLGGSLLALVVNAASYAVALACVLPLPARDVRARDRAKAREAIHHVRRHAELRLLLIVVLAQAAAFAALGTLQPIYARDVVGGGSVTYAAMEVAFGIGIVSGTIWSLRRGRRSLRVGSIAAHLGVGGVAVGVSVATASLAVSLAAFALMGLAAAGTFQPAKSALQLRTPESMHGRLLGLLVAAIAWVEIPSRSVIAVLTSRVSIPVLGVAFGALMVSAAIVVLVCARRCRHHEYHSRPGFVVHLQRRPARLQLAA